LILTRAYERDPFVMVLQDLAQAIRRGVKSLTGPPWQTEHRHDDGLDFQPAAFVRLALLGELLPVLEVLDNLARVFGANVTKRIGLGTWPHLPAVNRGKEFIPDPIAAFGAPLPPGFVSDVFGREIDLLIDGGHR